MVWLKNTLISNAPKMVPSSQKWVKNLVVMSRKSEQDGEGENGLIARDWPSDEPWEKQDGFLSETLDLKRQKDKIDKDQK